MTITNFTNILKTKPSYLKKGDSWLSENFGVSERTARQVKRSLVNVKRRYIKDLSN